MTNSIVDTMHLLALGTGDLHPTDADLANAPFLDSWHISNFSLLGYRVIGVVSGHPTIADGDINTSNPMHADLDRGWLRTRSRFYRLGAHKGDRS